LLVLGGTTGKMLLILVWGIAIVGILIKAFWVFCPKWVSSVLYIGMGWVCVLAFTKLLHALSPAAFGWLLAGGLIYTIGGVIYALKLPIFNSKHKNFGSHEIFHLFVLGGSVCHFVLVYAFIM
ncbi:MAG: hemolysin III family protein, partial [Lachnospiraceae bacterium]